MAMNGDVGQWHRPSKMFPYLHVNRHLLHTACDTRGDPYSIDVLYCQCFRMRNLCQWLKWRLVHCSLNILQRLKSHKCDSIKRESVNHLTGLSGHAWLCVCACMCAQLYFYVFYQLFNEACRPFTLDETWDKGGSMRVNTLLERLSSVNRVCLASEAFEQVKNIDISDR